jgi:hypothetical protein
VFLFGKVLQAIGFADVGFGLYRGMVRDDMWTELYMLVAGTALFYLGRLLERRA